jgi:protein involved in polysaccharide export with SLBB domain
MLSVNRGGGGRAAGRIIRCGIDSAAHGMLRAVMTRLPRRAVKGAAPLIRLLLVAAAFAANPALGQSTEASHSPVLRPGDAVRVQVWGRPEMGGELVVSPDGYLIHPLYRDIRVDNLTIPELEERLRSALEFYERDPKFVVEPLVRLVVGGAVRQPGMKSVPPGTTVRQAILEAGGVTEFGVLDRARLIRDGRVTTVDLSSEAVGQAAVASGDEIIVDRRRSVLRDIVVPVSSVVGAISSIAHVLWRLRN